MTRSASFQRRGSAHVALALAFLLATLLPGVRTLSAQAAGPCGPPIVNPVACENTNPGTPESQWDVIGAGDPSIQGFATDLSVNRGNTVSFKINTAAPSYTLTIYRLGYYQGNGARQIATVSPSAPLPQSQPACLSDAPTGLLDCGNWAVSASWQVPTTAVSGIYVARLHRPDTGASSHIVFIVRDDSSTSDILFQTDDTTWQAYNDYGGNSLYVGTAPSSDGRAYKVSYNRPFHTRSEIPGYGTSNYVFYGEYPMIRFLEQNGYDISYFTKIDADRSGSLIRNHKILLTSGHDEYWSAAERSAVEAARAAGVNLAFFTGNESFWKTRWENSIDGSGTPYRTLVTYKETKSPNPTDPQDPPIWTGTWRDPTWSPPADGGRPENAMTGTIFMVNRGSAPITVPSTYSRLRFWRNTSVATLGSGQTATLATDTVGYEWDEDLDNGARPAGLFDLSSTTVSVPELLQDYGNTYSPGTAVHHLTLYRSAGGGLVFGAGTVQWAWGLDPDHDTAPDTGSSTADVRMQQATVNLLADMGAQPATIMSGLVATAASTDTAPPTSTIAFPSGGATFAPNTMVTITGTAADTGGGVVAGVEVSVDGGTSWHPATGTSSWSYDWTPVRPGSVTIKSRAVDDSGNLESAGSGVTVTIGGGSTLPSFVSESGVTNGQTVPAPASIAAGDVLVAVMEVDTDPATVTGPLGWTRALDTPVPNGQGSNFHAQVWTKVATSSEPSLYTWSVSGNPWVDIGVLNYANVNSNPLDGIAGGNAGTTATPVTGSITTTRANDMVVASFIDYNSTSWTAGSGMTQRYSFDANTVQDAVQASAGSTGTKTATASSAGPTAALIMALKPVATDTTPPTVAMTAPANGATVSGMVAVSANASDDVAVASVQLLLDGNNLGPALTSGPYTYNWDTRGAANGSHQLKATATDTAGNPATSTPITVTVSNVGPTIANVRANAITTTTATISWTTDVSSSSQVVYGTTSGYGLSTALDPTLVTNHSQGLSLLQPATTYHYSVKSTDGSGNPSQSADFTFVTATPPPPNITNVQAGSITTSTATITWTTDTPSDTAVQYGPTTAYGSTASTAGLTTSHTQGLSALTPNTTYHYRVLSKDAYGQVSNSGDSTFSTPSGPPSFRSSSRTVNGRTVTKPTGVAAGDLLLAQIEVDADPVTVTGPAGWTLLLDTPAALGTASAFHAQVWYKVAAASEPTSYTWTVSGTPWVDIGLLDYANVNSTTPIDASNGTYAGTTRTPNTPAVTTTAPNDLVVAVFIDYNLATWTAGSGMTKRLDSDGNEAQDATQASAGSTGTRTATASVSGPVTAQIVALRAK